MHTRPACRRRPAPHHSAADVICTGFLLQMWALGFPTQNTITIGGKGSGAIAGIDVDSIHMGELCAAGRHRAGPVLGRCGSAQTDRLRCRSPHAPPPGRLHGP